MFSQRHGSMYGPADPYSDSLNGDPGLMAYPLHDFDGPPPSGYLSQDRYPPSDRLRGPYPDGYVDEYPDDYSPRDPYAGSPLFSGTDPPYENDDPYTTRSPGFLDQRDYVPPHSRGYGGALYPDGDSTSFRGDGRASSTDLGPRGAFPDQRPRADDREDFDFREQVPPNPSPYGDRMFPPENLRQSGSREDIADRLESMSLRSQGADNNAFGQGLQSETNMDPDLQDAIAAERAKADASQHDQGRPVGSSAPQYASSPEPIRNNGFVNGHSPSHATNDLQSDNPYNSPLLQGRPSEDLEPHPMPSGYQSPMPQNELHQSPPLPTDMVNEKIRLGQLPGSNTPMLGHDLRNDSILGTPSHPQTDQMPGMGMEQTSPYENNYFDDEAQLGYGAGEGFVHPPGSIPVSHGQYDDHSPSSSASFDTSFDPYSYLDQDMYMRQLESDRSLDPSERYARMEERRCWDELEDIDRERQWDLLDDAQRHRLGLGTQGWWENRRPESHLHHPEMRRDYGARIPDGGYGHDYMPMDFAEQFTGTFAMDQYPELANEMYMHRRPEYSHRYYDDRYLLFNELSDYAQELQFNHDLEDRERRRLWLERLRFEQLSEQQRMERYRGMAEKERLRIGLYPSGYYGQRFADPRRYDFSTYEYMNPAALNPLHYELPEPLRYRFQNYLHHDPVQEWRNHEMNPDYLAYMDLMAWENSIRRNQRLNEYQRRRLWKIRTAFLALNEAKRRLVWQRMTDHQRRMLGLHGSTFWGRRYGGVGHPHTRSRDMYRNPGPYYDSPPRPHLHPDYRRMEGQRRRAEERTNSASQEKAVLKMMSEILDREDSARGSSMVRAKQWRSPFAVRQEAIRRGLLRV